MKKRLESNTNKNSGLEKYLSEIVKIAVETVSMTQTGYRGENEYWYSTPHISYWEGKLLEVLDYGLMVEGSGGQNTQIIYDLKVGYIEKNIPHGKSYFPFYESETIYEGEITEHAYITQRKIIYVSYNDRIVYKTREFLEGSGPGSNYYHR